MVYLQCVVSYAQMLLVLFYVKVLAHWLHCYGLSPVCSLICLVRSHFLETFFSTKIALIWHMCVNLIKPGKIIISCTIFSTVITWIWLIICVDFLIQLPGIFTIFLKSLGRFSKRIYLKINFR